MAVPADEEILLKQKPADRRGVFTTWGSNTWEALLARSTGDVTAHLAKCAAVGATQCNITNSVMDGTWEPPAGEWLLVVQMDTQDWVTLVTNNWPGEAFEKLARQFDGQLLLTGHSDTAGTVYARVVEADANASDGVKLRLDFQSDGSPWDDDEDDEDDEFDDADEDDEFEDDDDEFEDDEDGDEEYDDMEEMIEKLTETRLVAEDLSSDWLQQFDSLPAAHQALLRHLDAYVPGLYYSVDDSKLTAPFGHDDILPHITKIDLVRLGAISKDEPSPSVLKWTRKLHDAISQKNIDDVRIAISNGASLAPTNGDSSALYSACFNLAYSPYEPRVAVIELLLDAGADPNNNRSHQDNDYCDTPLSRLIQASRPPFEVAAPIARKLAQRSADLNAPSPYPLTLGERPLHTAAKKALPEWVKLLLELGADPLATSDAGRTPRESVLDLIAGKEASDFYSAADVEKERNDYAPILEMLAEAEAKAQT